MNQAIARRSLFSVYKRIRNQPITTDLQLKLLVFDSVVEPILLYARVWGIEIVEPLLLHARRCGVLKLWSHFYCMLGGVGY